MKKNNLPKNSLAIFICYKLLKNANLSMSSSEPNYTLESNDPFNIPKVFKIPQQRKKQIKYLSANLKLNTFIKQSLFGSWKKSSQASLSFKKKLNIKTKSFIFKILKEFADKRIIMRFQLTKHIKSKSKRLYSQIFDIWSHYTSEKIQLRALESAYHESKNQVALSSLFKRWESLSVDKRRLQRSEKVVAAYTRKKLLLKYFKIISSVFTKKNKVNFRCKI